MSTSDAVSGIRFGSDTCRSWSRESCVYTKCYCEENVWHLCRLVVGGRDSKSVALANKENDVTSCKHLESKIESMPSTFFAVFLSNQPKQMPLWEQIAGDPQLSGFVLWDYHVLLLERDAAHGCSYIYDLDSTLPFPCEAETYISQAIRMEDSFKPKFRRRFRVIPAEEFARCFASDRSHMKVEDPTAPEGFRWLAPPPVYDCIRSKDSQMNLPQLLSMTAMSSNPEPMHSLLLDLAAFVRFVSPTD